MKNHRLAPILSLLISGFVFLSGSASAYPVATLAEAQAKGSSLALGEYIGCYLYKDSNGTAQGSCFGPKFFSERLIPKISVQAPVQIVAPAAQGVCILDATGVKCWNNYATDYLESVPTLESPYLLAADSALACAIDASGLVCWGDKYFSVMGKRSPNGRAYQYRRPLPPGRRATYLVMSDWNAIIGLDDGSYHLVGANKELIDTFLKNERYSSDSLRLTNRAICRNAGQWECIDFSDQKPIYNIPAEARDLSLGYKYACWLNSFNQPVCHGSDSPFNELRDLPSVTQAHSVAAGDGNICIQGSDGSLHCSGALKSTFALNVTKHPDFLFELARFEAAAPIASVTPVTKPTPPPMPEPAKTRFEDL